MQHLKDQLYPGGLKYVRWAYTAKNNGELSVRERDEVEILKREHNNMYLVQVKDNDERVGYIPGKCFCPRVKVNFAHERGYSDEISVSVGEIIGIIKSEDRQKLRVMKNGIEGIEGLIPEKCLYRRFEAYTDYTPENQEQLSIKKGDYVGFMEENEDCWKVYFNDCKGLVPSRCFEPPHEVHWDYKAQEDDEITVKCGDTVTLVDHHRPQRGEQRMVKVRLGEKIGCIPMRSFDIPHEVYSDYTAKNASELAVKKGDRVALTETTGFGDKPPEGYLKVRLGNNFGFIPKTCFELPVEVIRDYNSAELTLKKGQWVHVVDATMKIKVRCGEDTGQVPFSYINSNQMEGLVREISMETITVGVSMEMPSFTMTSFQSARGQVQKILTLLEKRKEDDDEHAKQKGNSELESKKEASEVGMKSTPRLEDLTLMKWKDEEGRDWRLEIIKIVGAKWRDIGALLGLSVGELDGYWSMSHENADCCNRVFSRWINNNGHPPNYSLSWLGLEKLLRDILHAGAADDLRSALKWGVM